MQLPSAADYQLDDVLSARAEQLTFTGGQREMLTLFQKLVHGERDKLVISGYAGTGKTTCVENMITYGRQQGNRVALLAPTNVAVKTARGKFPHLINQNNSKTLHAALYPPPDDDGEFQIGNPKSLRELGDIVIVDETSMISIDVLNDLHKSAKESGVKLVFLGDGFQLEPVERDPRKVGKQRILQDGSDVELTEVRRQADGSTVLELATVMRAENRVIYPNRDWGEIKVFTEGDLDRYARLSRETKGDVAYVVGTNKSRVNINLDLRTHRYGEGVNNKWDSRLYAGEPIISISNSDYHANGSVFKIAGDPEYRKSGKFTRTVKHRGGEFEKSEYYYRYQVEDDQGQKFKLFLFPWTRLPSIHNSQIEELVQGKGPNKEYDRSVVVGTYGYAISGHKSQGGQRKAIMVLPEGSFLDNQHWAYVAVTRTEGEVHINTSNLHPNQMMDPEEIHEKFLQITS